jgi:hypothetical protein
MEQPLEGAKESHESQFKTKDMESTSKTSPTHLSLERIRGYHPWFIEECKVQ